MIEQIIRKIDLFASLPSEEILFLADNLRSVEFPANALLFREGEIGELFFILVSGEVEIIKALDSPDERSLGIRSAGTLLGEMSLFNLEGKRTASVRAHTRIQLLEMTRTEFDALLHRNPALAYDMISVLSRRLAESENQTIRDLHRKNQELTLAYQELKAAQEQIIEKERLERELQVARGIQLSMMPRRLPKHTGYLFEASIQPMRAVGGDFYDFITLGRDCLGVVIGDVSDHGVPAALFMAMTVTLLRAEAKRSPTPVEVLRRVNHLLLKNNEAGLFVTILYGVLHYTTGQFEFARAGHERPLVSGRSGDIHVLGQGSGAALGFYRTPVLEEGQYTLNAGETLLLYTDGMTDEMNTREEAYGLPRLIASLSELSRFPGSKICPALLAKLHAHRGASPQFDDITLLAVHALGS